MIRAICITNEKEVFEAPELFYMGHPITVTEFLDTEDPEYSAQIILDKKDDSFYIKFLDGIREREFFPNLAEAIDDLYFQAWRCVRKSDGKLSMEWSNTLCKKTDANFVEISKCMNQVIDRREISRKFIGFDGKEYDLKNDDKLIRIIDDIVRQTYLPALAKSLTENGFSRKKK